MNPNFFRSIAAAPMDSVPDTVHWLESVSLNSCWAAWRVKTETFFLFFIIFFLFCLLSASFGNCRFNGKSTVQDVSQEMEQTSKNLESCWCKEDLRWLNTVFYLFKILYQSQIFIKIFFVFHRRLCWYWWYQFNICWWVASPLGDLCVCESSWLSVHKPTKALEGPLRPAEELAEGSEQHQKLITKVICVL